MSSIPPRNDAAETGQNLLERQLAPLLQVLLIVLQVAIVALLAANIALGNVAPGWRLLAPNALIIVILFGSLLLLRRGYLKPSLWVLISIVLAAETYILFSSDLSISDRTLMNFVIPISLAGLFLGRISLVVVTLISVGVVWVSAGQSLDTLVGGLPATSTAIQYTVIASIYALMVDIFRVLYRQTLTTAITQSAALERIQIDNVTLYEQAESERERLQVTLASIGDAVITTDVSAKITFMNAIAEQLTGWTLEAAKTATLPDVFHIVNEDTGALVENPVDRVLHEGIIVGLANHTVLIAADGNQTPIADSAAPIRNAQGRVIGAVLVFRGVEDERKAQIVLEESEARFRTLADSAPVLIWMSDLSKACTYFNQTWLDFTGRTIAQELGYGWTEGVHPDDFDFCVETYNAAFDARTAFSMDYRLRHHDGDYRWVADNGIPRFAPDGSFLGFVGSCIDITERKQQESRTRLLQEITARFSEALTPHQVADVVMERVMALLDSHLSAMYASSSDGSVLELLSAKGGNASIAAEYQTLDFDAPGPLLDAIREREPVWISTLSEYTAHYPEFAGLVQKNGSQSIACLPLIVNGQTIGGISLSFPTPMPFEPALRHFIVAIAQQCAQALDRARLYEGEAHARQQAEAADRLKLQFLAMISHELRTPLTSIKGFSSTLLAPDVEWEQSTQLEFLGILDAEADRLTELVEQLLDVTRLQAGNLTIDPALQSFAHIVESVDHELQTLTQQHQLVKDLPANLPLIQADGRRIAQVLTNLVGNAAKYAPRGTEITLRAEASGDSLYVTITDAGIGIPPEARETVFEAFQQLEQRRNGAGLGLAICRGLVEAHGGRIWIEERDTPGTQVVFTLPLTESISHINNQAAAP